MKNSDEIRLEEFCEMEEFYQLLENWTKITGISTTAVDMHGNLIAPAFGMAEYCSMIRSREEGLAACIKNWKLNLMGVYECHAGFFDFAIPIKTPDGIQLGKVLAGQVLAASQSVERVIEKSKKYNLSEQEVREVVERTKRRGEEELESIYNLLKQMVDMFIEKSYQKWYESKQMYEVVSNAGVGLWKITLVDGERPKLSVSDKMRELLAVDYDGITDEERYEEWFKRIKESAIPSVEASVAEMLTHTMSENIYIWNHPTFGERYVRCGGIGEHISDNCNVLSGYHSDITELVSKENKQKQLLADALKETKRQKELLQEALDNYKKADYDRRTDFLTGLKSRQDMYEILYDKQSSIKEQLNAVFMLDVDNFKLFNDNYGHLAGDNCLKKIGKALKKYEKENHMNFFRYGGEEILGLSFSDEKDAGTIAEELVRLISDLNIKREDVSNGVVTISVGYTTDVLNMKKMINQADAALYESKAKGRNQATIYKEVL